ncbi:MAG: helix-turn-helix domain-containing protein [Desulfotignum sp.]
MAKQIDDILAIDELAAYLKISKSTLYKLVREGKIPSQKIGRHWRFRKKALTNGLKKHKLGIFACYRFPSAGKQKNTRELGELRWYFLPHGSTEIMTAVDQINTILACNKDTPRHPCRMLSYRRDRLSVIEAYIRSRELKTRKSVTMA